MISRAKLRGRKLDEDCKRACTSTNEYGPDDEDGALIIEGE